MSNIKLGDKVRCKITGFEGVAVAKTEFINGCIQWMVTPKAKGGKYPEDIGIDEGSLEVIKPKLKKREKKNDGGPVTKGQIMRGF